jgi:hypothetical protein
MTANRLLCVWPGSGICAVHEIVIRMLGQRNEESPGNRMLQGTVLLGTVSKAHNAVS